MLGLGQIVIRPVAVSRVGGVMMRVRAPREIAVVQKYDGHDGARTP